jgi:hypothetical protein
MAETPIVTPKQADVEKGAPHGGGGRSEGGFAPVCLMD